MGPDPQRRRLATAAIALAVVLVGAPPAAASPAADANETIDIDLNCTDGTVQFTASNDTEYVASLTAVNMSATTVTTVRQTRTVSGNVTFTASSADVYGAFASSGTLGNEDTVSEIQVCNGTAC